MKVRTILDIKSLGAILGVWAHPDDETFSCAGIMAAAIQNNQIVACVTATKGEAGIQDPKRWPPEKLGDIRMHEMAVALAEMGIKNHHWLNYPDGGCQQASSHEATEQLVGLINQYQPQTILTFGPDGMTGHPDHQTVSAWAHAAVVIASQSAYSTQAKYATEFTYATQAKYASEATKNIKATKDTPKTPKSIQIYHAVQSREMYDRYLKSADEKFNIFYNIDEPPLREQAHCDICFQLPSDLLERKMRALEAMPSQTEAMMKSTPRQELLESFGVECFEKAS